ncbi:MAG: outer membrane protein transport protein [Flavobacteriaceae bacterium]|nr:outer membrane protein transport protein [Flavobacteriaceae bacterium]
MKKLFSFLILVLATSSVFAGGYRVSIQGQKQLAMGHTGVAVISSAETVFFNPASMAFLEDKFNLSVGASGIFSQVKFQNTEFGWTSETDNPLGTPLNLYATYKANDWLTFGLGVYTPYGSRVEWEEDWAGSHLVNDIDLSAIFIQPSVSIKLADFFSIGGGPIYVTGGVNFNRNLSRSLTDDTGENRANVTIDASGINAWGYNVGWTLKPTDKLTIGFNYRSEITMKAEDGDADFENIPPSLGFDDTTFDSEIPLPSEVTVGLSYQITDKWLAAFDYNRTQWSAYESLNVTFNNAAGTSVNLRNYSDASTYRFGLQYAHNSKFTFRGGIYFDESPIEDGYFAPETPRGDSVGYTGGLTYNVTDKLGIDLSFLYLSFKEETNSYDYFVESNGENSSFGGTYSNSTFAPGIGVSYKF